jgi:hypothetical protein
VNSNIYCGCGRDIVGGGGRDLFCFVFGGGCGNGTASSVNICYFFCGSDSGSVPSSLGFSFIRYDIILRRLFSYFFSLLSATTGDSGNDRSIRILRFIDTAVAVFFLLQLHTVLCYFTQ